MGQLSESGPELLKGSISECEKLKEQSGREEGEDEWGFPSLVVAQAPAGRSRWHVLWGRNSSAERAPCPWAGREHRTISKGSREEGHNCSLVYRRAGGQHHQQNGSSQNESWLANCPAWALDPSVPAFSTVGERPTSSAASLIWTSLPLCPHFTSKHFISPSLQPD